MQSDIENNLLQALRADDLELVRPHLKAIKVEAGMHFYQPGDIVRTVYFPCGSAMAAFIVELADGKGVETALVGREGAVGGIVSQGRLPSYSRCTVQFSGTFLMMESARLEEIKLQSMSLRHLFARYADCLMAQIFQTTACNAGHTIEQRAAKWLIAAIERTGNNDVRMTQEQLAAMLGVGRSYISRVISALKICAIVETKRGGISVLDIDSLRALACDCNEEVKRHFDEVLRGVYPALHEDA